MTFTMTIEMNNAAFADPRDEELLRILQVVRAQVSVRGAEVGSASNVLDFNGNTVGRWEITDDPA